MQRSAYPNAWRIAVALAAAIGAAKVAAAEPCPRPEDWDQDDTLRIGYRIDAPPFSFAKPTPLPGFVRPAGYNVEICRQVAEHLVLSFHRAHEATEPERRLSVEWVPVTADSRFRDLSCGRIDLLCGTATVTVERLRHFESSLFTFVTGASFICREPGNLKGLAMLKDKTIGYVAGSTTPGVVERLQQGGEIDGITMIALGDYRGAVEALRLGESKACNPGNAPAGGPGDRPETAPAERDAGAATAPGANPPEQRLGADVADAPGDATGNVQCIVGDRDVLNAYYARLEPCEQRAAYFDPAYYSLEPYALFTRRGDDPSLLYEVNRRLVELFREEPSSRNSIHSIFEDFFGNARMSDHLTKLFEVQKLPFGEPPELCDCAENDPPASTPRDAAASPGQGAAPSPDPPTEVRNPGTADLSPP